MTTQAILVSIQFLLIIVQVVSGIIHMRKLRNGEKLTEDQTRAFRILNFGPCILVWIIFFIILLM